MKNQINATNIIGAVISASLLILSQFSTVRDAASKALKLGTFQTDKNTRLTGFSISSGPTSDKKIQISSVTSTTRIQSPCLNQVEKSLQEITVPETQKQEPTSVLLVDKSPQPHSESNGCPKNLDYFTKKPRPKQTPEECMTCQNLVSCVGPCTNQVEKSLQEITVPETQKQEPTSVLLVDKSPQPPSGSNGCPKNLDYFTKKPRPKQIPEQCMTCKNLISCVCLTRD